ncbi:chemotaxis protein CheW [Ectothiorhodospiraceae bacterium BW-2]|nr:chemotaxis protein CheW [Ectothiorhodospiraceae bacterium BW-2]
MINDDGTKGSDPLSRWVTFTLEHEVYGIDVMQIREVLRSPEISPVPGAPAYVLGIINLRGNVVAIIDTRARFGLPSHDLDDSSRILILETKEYVVGFMVDSVSEVVELRSSSIEPAPSTGARESTRYISGLYNREKGLLILIDANKLLSESELVEIASM